MDKTKSKPKKRSQPVLIKDGKAYPYTKENYDVLKDKPNDTIK